jgi:hypothetical protein
VAVQPYPEDQAEQFAELAELFLRCRLAWRNVTSETRGHFGSGSTAADDHEAVAREIAPLHAASRTTTRWLSSSSPRTTRFWRASLLTTAGRASNIVSSRRRSTDYSRTCSRRQTNRPG